MNILLNAPYVPSRIRVRPYHLVKELSRAHTVTVLAVGSEEKDADALDELRNVCSRVEVVPLSAGNALRSLAAAAMRREPLQSAVCYSPALRQRLQALLNATSFDVVHIEHLRAARLRSDIPSDMPVVFDSVDSISLLLQRTLRSSHSLKQRAIARLELQATRRYEARLMREFDHVVVTSSDDARMLGALAPGAPVTVIPNGVDLENFYPLEGRSDAATLVFSGKMSYHANASAILHFVRDILPLVRERRPDVRVLIVGSNPPDAVRALSRDPAITVTGEVPDMREALGRASVAICPMTVKVGIQNKVLEGMAVGLPVVCSQAGAEGIDAEPGRDFFVAEDDTAFARYVCQLVDDPNLREQLGRSGRRYVEARHRWSAAADQLAEVYAAVVEAHRLDAVQRVLNLEPTSGSGGSIPHR